MTEYFDELYLTDDQALIRARSQAIHTLLKGAHWTTGRTEEQMAAAIDHSLCWAIFRQADDTPVGFARVITDFATIVYLSDVFVDDTYRVRDLGSRLVEKILSEPRLQGITALLKTHYAADFYRKFGFEVYPATCMIREAK